MDLPFESYVSHKRVGALRIAQICRDDPTGDRITRLDLGVSADHIVASLHNPDPLLFARYMPEVGDYLVQYDGEYLSISPRKPFDDGYTREVGG